MLAQSQSASGAHLLTGNVVLPVEIPWQKSSGIILSIGPYPMSQSPSSDHWSRVLSGTSTIPSHRLPRSGVVVGPGTTSMESVEDEVSPAAGE